MAWIALSDRNGGVFRSRGLGLSAQAARLVPADDGALMVRGSLVIETRLPTTHRPRPMVFYDRQGDWPFHLSLQAIPGGGLVLVLNQGGEVMHRAIGHSDAGRADLLRITYTWDAPARSGQLSLERSDRDAVQSSRVVAPQPLRVGDLRRLVCDPGSRYLSPEVLFLALSSDLEPVGPTPTLFPDTPVATPAGYRAVGSLKRGDTIFTPEGKIVPVLHAISRTVPARGSWQPVRLRAPYFGLQQDIVTAPSQRLVLSGSDVEYLFNQEAVLVEVRHLVGGTSAVPEDFGPTVTYTQLILPEHEALVAAGTVAESLYIGRLRRKNAALQASVLAGLERSLLPDHGKPLHRVLPAFDAIVLAEQRAA